MTELPKSAQEVTRQQAQQINISILAYFPEAESIVTKEAWGGRTR